MHRYLVNVSEKQFREEWDRLMALPGDGSYDGGDAIWDAERKIGVAPWEVASHAGLMAITRAVSLSEVTIARMAAAHFDDPDHWIFPEGQLWFREWERKFYRTVPISSFNIDGNGFGTVRSLRNLYSHGYGIPATEARRNDLALKLYSQFDTGPLTPEEEKLGYTGDVYFFGDDVRFSSRTQELDAGSFVAKRADISPLATYRLLNRIKMHIEAAHGALSGGVTMNLTAKNNSFVETVEKWWAKKAR